MFVQIIRGTTSDPDGVRERGQRWREELRPGADGFLGSTSGISPEGEVFTIARFADEAAARQNSERAEQGAWWAETEKLIDGVTFAESTDVETLHGGGSDDAGFVQVMEGSYTDADAVRAMTADAGEMLAKVRPDLLGALLVLQDGGRFTQVAYFTSEADARDNEGKDVPDEAAANMAEMDKIMKVDRYIDLPEPDLTS